MEELYLGDSVPTMTQRIFAPLKKLRRLSFSRTVMLVDSSIENLAVMCPSLEFVVLSLPFRENSQQMYNTIVEFKGRTTFVGEHALNASIGLDAFKKLLPLVSPYDIIGGPIVQFLERSGYSNDVVIYAAQVFGYNDT